MDWARYMVENPDVYNMFSDGGKWSWGNGRKQNAYMREDGSPLQAETAAQYAQNHYNNFGKREGRKVHEANGTDYASMLGGGGSGAGPTDAMLMSVTALTKQIADLKENGGSKEEIEELKRESRTLLTDFGYNLDEDSKKKKSYLTPIGGQS